MLGLVHVVVSSSNDLSNQIVLEVSLPGGVRQLGQDEEQGEEVGEPEVVGGDGGVLLGLQLALVNKAAGGPALELRTYVCCSMDPAIRPGMEKNESCNEQR